MCAVISVMTAACAVHQSDQAPPLTGPSTFAQSISLTATPDLITQDGQSQSAITVRVFGANGQPMSAIPLRIDILVNGSLVDYGTLSTKSIVTGTDGRATTVYTAPPAPPPTAQTSSTVTIRATAIGTDTPASAPFSADIRLVPPGVILPPAETPTPDFAVTPTPVNLNIAALFDASASCGGAVTNGGCSGSSPITSYAWTFGDGSAGSGKTVSHTYVTTGTFNATLTVTNQRGLAASKTLAITVGATDVPTVAFEFSPDSPLVGQQVVFNAAASHAAVGRTIVSYSWNFGDGDTAVGVGATHAFTSAGTYNVTLTVTDDAGQKMTAAKPVTTGGTATAPTAKFTKSPTQPTVNEVVVFSAATSTTAQGRTITDYFWNFGDDPSCPQVSGTVPPTCYTQTSSPNITHQYARNGTFTVNLVVRDSSGQVGSTQDTVPVGAGLPIATITVSPPSPTRGVAATFDGSGTTTSGGATILSYIWNFGDNTGDMPSVPLNNPSRTHIFATPGSYVVRLTVVDSQNRSGTATITVVVQ